MFNSGVKTEILIDLHVRLDKATMDKLTITARNRNEPLAAVIRRILSAGLDTEIAESSLDTIKEAVRKAIRTGLKPTENRMAKLAAKASKAAGATMYLIESFRIGSSTDKKAASASSTDRIKSALSWAAKYLKQPEGDDDNA